ncbi:MAG: hypothetical protein FJW36_19550 [Acidobacteria bacterium]|nr:hypothetical protein [Acidobacteriota bacterium]
MNSPKQPQPIPMPESLSKASQQLWNDLAATQARSLERRQMFLQALRALDRAEACREAIDREGLMIGGEGKIAHINPLLKAEKDARGQFAAIWKALHLTYNGAVDGRRLGPGA